MNNHPSHYSPASLDFIQSSSLFNDASSPSVSNLLSNQSFVGSYEAEANPHFVSLLSFPTMYTPSQQNETTCYRFASSMCSSAREEQPASWPAPPFPDNVAFTSIQPSLIFPRSSDDGQPHNSPVYPPHFPHLSRMGEHFRAPERTVTQNHIPQSTRCSWDGKCDMLLEDLSPSGIARHLKVHHFADSWDDRRRGTCRWHGSPCTGGRPIFYASYGKHIAAVHLGTSSRQCPRCGRAFVRPDTLDRHMKRYCHAPTPEASSESCGL